ncbi:hypothetical protein PENTCL1PPCAC_2409, partial [Pristionchus entomophagus]
PFLIVCITGLILIIVGLIFLCSKGVAYWAESKYKRYIKSDPSDIENLEKRHGFSRPSPSLPFSILSIPFSSPDCIDSNQTVPSLLPYNVYPNGVRKLLLILSHSGIFAFGYGGCTESVKESKGKEGPSPLSLSMLRPHITPDMVPPLLIPCPLHHFLKYYSSFFIRLHGPSIPSLSTVSSYVFHII